MLELDGGTATRMKLRRGEPFRGQTLMLTMASAASNVVSPSDMALDFPGQWISMFRAAVEKAGLKWMEPHRAGTDDEVSLEWWNNTRNITVFVRGYQAEVLKVWGSNVEHEMEEVHVTQREQFAELWRWLSTT